MPASMTARTSLTPAVTAESSANRRPVARLTRWAMVVFPVPGGPTEISETARSSPSTRRRSGDPGARGAAGRPARRVSAAASARRAVRRHGRPRRIEEVRTGHAGRQLQASGAAALGTKSMPASARCASVIGVGAPVRGSPPDAVFGKAITSRIDEAPASSATSRSSPKAMPPCGGGP